MKNGLDRRTVLKGTAALALAGATGGLANRAPGAAAMPLDRVPYGVALRADRVAEDADLRRAVLADCDWITPEIDFKWNALEYRQGQWWFERADALTDFARANGKALRGHTLLWDQSTPDWAKAELAERRDWRLIQRWFATVLGRYGEQAVEWDVINEPIDTETGTAGLRRNCFHRAFGPEYIGRALHLAHARAPSARLLVNEYSLEYANPVERDRRRALLRLAEALLAEGAPLHAIGLQAHLDLAKGPLDATGIAEMLREIADLGLDVTVTELDVREADRNLPVARRDRAIADEVAGYLDIVNASGALRGVVTWGMSDQDSWLQGDGPLHRALPRDAELTPKPMHTVLRRAVEGGPSHG